MILFYITEALRIFKRASLASFFAIISSTLAIILISISVLLLFLSDNINARLKNQIEINVFLENDIPELDRNSLQDELVNNNNLGYVKYISEDEAADSFISDTGEDFKKILELNPLPASFVVRLKPEFVSEENINGVINKYKDLEGVDEVKCDFETALLILGFIDTGKYVVHFFTVFIILVAAYFVYSAHRLWVISRKVQINTMKLVGAKISSIKVPIILNGMLIGAISGTICLILYWVFVEFINNIYKLSFLDSAQSYSYLLIFVGILLGLLTSIFSTRDISLKVGQL